MKKQSMDKPSLGDRMKNNYEKIFMQQLPFRMPVIIRLDGRAFHTFTRNFRKPYDEDLMNWMNITAHDLCENIQGAQLAYVQSDEISILVHYYKKLNSQPWFNNEIQKMVSISAGLASSLFTSLYMCSRIEKRQSVDISAIMFDSRVFVLPENEVCNYFIWRQQDWIRNSIQMLAQSLFSQKELHKKNQIDMISMCKLKGKNWNSLSNEIKYGRCIKYYDNTQDWRVDEDVPVFTKNREYIEQHLNIEEE